MKRMIAFLLGIGLGATVQANSLATTCNMVGFVNVPTGGTNQYTCVGMNFQSIGGRFGSLSDLLGSQLRKSDQLDKSSKVMLWDADAQQFVAYGLKKDGQFYAVNEWLTARPYRKPLRPGSVMLVQGGVERLTICGEACQADAVTNSLAGGPARPLNLICYPYPVPVDVQRFISIADGAQASDVMAQADRLTLWDATKRSFVTLGLKADGKWHPLNNWAANKPYTGVIKPGEGAYFQSSRPIIWVVRRPYDSMTATPAPAQVQPAAIFDEGSGLLNAPIR